MRLGEVPAGETGRETAPLWPPLLSTRGPGGLSARHGHHAMHFVIALAGELRVQGEGDAAFRPAAGVLTAPGAAHAIDARDCEVLLVFLDPEGDAGSKLRGCFSGPVRLLTDRERRSLLNGAEPASIMQQDGVDWTRRAVATLGKASPEPVPVRVHPKVKKLLRRLDALSRGGAVSLEDMASAVELSPGRLIHVFTESVGVPPRPYLTWLKLQRAAAAIVSGAPLAEAAQRAGFSDAAHMSRVFRQMLGVTPSSLRPNRPVESPAS